MNNKSSSQVCYYSVKQDLITRRAYIPGMYVLFVVRSFYFPGNSGVIKYDMKR